MTSNSDKIRFTIVMFLSVSYCQLIEQAALVKFIFYLSFQNLENLILNILKEKLHISCLVSIYNSTVQTAAISKTMIKFWSKFHIQILWYCFTKDNRFPLSPSNSLPGRQVNPSSSAPRHIQSSLSMYLFLDFELQWSDEGAGQESFQKLFFVTK